MHLQITDETAQTIIVPDQKGPKYPYQNDKKKKKKKKRKKKKKKKRMKSVW